MCCAGPIVQPLTLKVLEQPSMPSPTIPPLPYTPLLRKSLYPKNATYSSKPWPAPRAIVLPCRQSRAGFELNEGIA